MALAAAGQAVSTGWLLTVIAHFLRAGVAGTAEIDVEPIKNGRHTSTVGAALRQAGKERVRMLATYRDLGPEAADGQ